MTGTTNDIRISELPVSAGQVRDLWRQVEEDRAAGKDLYDTLTHPDMFSRVHLMKTAVVGRAWIKKYPGKHPDLETLLERLDA